LIDNRLLKFRHTMREEKCRRHAEEEDAGRNAQVRCPRGKVGKVVLNNSKEQRKRKTSQAD
jgi:hypothetical protein